MNRRTIGTVAGLVVVSILVIGCPGGGREAPDADAIEMRAYTVPEGFNVGEFRSHIRGSLATGDVKLGTALTYPDGSLVVTAPRGIHDGIERLLEDLRARGPAPEPPSVDTVTLRYWAILGQPTVGSSDVPAALRQAEELQPVIEELHAAYGPMRFGLLESLRLTGTADRDRSSIRGRHLLVEQRVARNPDGTGSADLAISMHGDLGVWHQLETRIGLDPGTSIVLAQSAYHTGRGFLPAGWSASDDDIMLFLVVAEQTD